MEAIKLLHLHRNTAKAVTLSYVTRFDAKWQQTIMLENFQPAMSYLGRFLHFAPRMLHRPVPDLFQPPRIQDLISIQNKRVRHVFVTSTQTEESTLEQRQTGGSEAAAETQGDLGDTDSPTDR